MKKILYIIQLPPPVYGVTTVNKLVFESEKVNKEFKKSLINVSYSSSLSELRKFNLTKLAKLIALFAKLIYKAITFKPDFAYCTVPPVGLGLYKELPNIFVMKMFGIKPIFHLHGKGIESASSSFILKIIYKFCFSKAIIIHLSPGLIKSEFKNLNLKEAQFFAVGNGLPEAPVSPKKIKSCSELNFLFLSNIQESKGIFMLLESFSEFLKSYPDSRLNIVGGFRDKLTEERFYKVIDELDINHNINYFGEKYDAEKHKIISTCDVLIHPSFNDAYPLVILEAMQHGLAILASDQGAIPEIVAPDFGIVFPTGCQKCLLSSMCSIASDSSLLNSMQGKARQTFEAKHTLSIFEENLTSVFRGLE